MNSPVETYIVRIYRCGGGARRRLVGLIEAPRTSGSRGFTSVEQLWEILAARAPARRTRASGLAADPKVQGRLRDVLCPGTPVIDGGSKLELKSPL